MATTIKAEAWASKRFIRSRPKSQPAGTVLCIRSRRASSRVFAPVEFVSIFLYPNKNTPIFVGTEGPAGRRYASSAADHYMARHYRDDPNLGIMFEHGGVDGSRITSLPLEPGLPPVRLVLAALPGPAEGVLPEALSAIPEVALRTLHINLSELIRHLPGNNVAFARMPLAEIVDTPNREYL